MAGLSSSDDSGTGGGGATYSEIWKEFTGDGVTTDFDCEVVPDRIQVNIGGITMSPADYTKDDTLIKFNNAPEDKAEIKIWILDED